MGGGLKLEISFEWGTTRISIGHLLFLIYINDLDDNITSNILKFVDDTKVFRCAKNDGDKQHLPNDLDKLVKWSEKWYVIQHTGHGNLYCT